MKRKQQQKQKKKERKRTAYHWTHSGSSKIQKRQFRGSLNRYGFAYARRHKVNQAAKVAPGVIKAATNDINNVSEKSANQIRSEGLKQSECISTKLLPGTTEDVYQTPFTLLGEFFYLRFIT